MVWEATDLLSNKLLLKLYSVRLKDEIMVLKSTSNWLLEIKLRFLEKMAKSDTSSSCVSYRIQLYIEGLYRNFVLDTWKRFEIWCNNLIDVCCRLCSSRKYSLFPTPSTKRIRISWGGGRKLTKRLVGWRGSLKTTLPWSKKL